VTIFVLMATLRCSCGVRARAVPVTRLVRRRLCLRRPHRYREDCHHSRCLDHSLLAEDNSSQPMGCTFPFAARCD
jgi:hypothetical protein